MKLNKYKILLLLLLLLSIRCQGEDTTGKIVIEYDKSWSGTIIHKYSQASVSGTGRQEYIYTNPDNLSAIITKQDNTLDKLTVYIYEDERIAAAEFTRDPQGSVTVQYDFPY